jgi:hypothetical protein
MTRARVGMALPAAIAAVALMAAPAAEPATAGKAADRAAKRCAAAQGRIRAAAPRPAVTRHRRKARRSQHCRARGRYAVETLRDLGVSRGPADPSAPGDPSTPQTPATPGPSYPRYIGVTTSEFTLVLSRPKLAPGEAIVELVNRGEDPHDLKVAPEGSDEASLSFPEARPGQVLSGQIHLTEGTWRLWCSLPGHEQAGMVAHLQVSG